MPYIYYKETARKYFMQCTLSLNTDKSILAVVVFQPIMNRGLSIVLCKPVFVVQPDNETTLEAAERTTRSQTSRKTRTRRNNGDRNPPIALDRRDTNGNA